MGAACADACCGAHTARTCSPCVSHSILRAGAWLTLGAAAGDAPQSWRVQCNTSAKPLVPYTAGRSLLQPGGAPIRVPMPTAVLLIFKERTHQHAHLLIPCGTRAGRVRRRPVLSRQATVSCLHKCPVLSCPWLQDRRMKCRWRAAAGAAPEAGGEGTASVQGAARPPAAPPGTERPPPHADGDGPGTRTAPSQLECLGFNRQQRVTSEGDFDTVPLPARVTFGAHAREQQPLRLRVQIS